MDKLKCSIGVLICLMILYSAQPAWPQSESAQSNIAQKSSSDVAAANPFAAILQASGSNSQKSSGTSKLSNDPPELLAQTVTLSHIDANSVTTAFRCMCSGYGSIHSIQKSNSIIIVDTQDNLETILAEIKKLDKPIPGLTVFAVSLKYLDAESVKTVLEVMCSKYGTISVVEKANSLIISDTAESLQAILAEVAKIDKRIPGLIVSTVTLNSIDAKSAKTALEKMLSEHGSITVIERTNSLIICDRKENLDAILAEIAKIDKPTSGLFVKTINLKFLEAKNLKNVLDKMVSEYGSIATNEKSNSLIICDTKENLEKILAEVREADQTPQQIIVEVVILDVQLKDDTELGINWDSDISVLFGVDYEQKFGTGTESDSSLVTLTGTGGISNVIHTIQQKRDAQILASPRAMMLSGQSATIEAVEEIPYKEIMDTAEGGAAALTSTQFKDVGVTLQVTATVTDGNNIFLKVETTHNVKTGQSESGVPVVDTRRANTSLLLKDGQIVVMGGLRRSENVEQIYQIPILGDMPILGGLFKDTNTVIYNSELVVLLSPCIYKGEPVPHEVISKYNEIMDRPMFLVKTEKQEKTE
jgi:type II secretory pathway component GspD/PulD (secretin)